jgi:hypothetical protein
MRRNSSMSKVIEECLAVEVNNVILHDEYMTLICRVLQLLIKSMRVVWPHWQELPELLDIIYSGLPIICGQPLILGGYLVDEKSWSRGKDRKYHMFTMRGPAQTHGFGWCSTQEMAVMIWQTPSSNLTHLRMSPPLPQAQTCPPSLPIDSKPFPSSI